MKRILEMDEYFIDKRLRVSFLTAIQQLYSPETKFYCQWQLLKQIAKLKTFNGFVLQNYEINVCRAGRFLKQKNLLLDSH